MPLQPWAKLLEEAGDSTDFTVLPAADYDVKIIDAKAKMSGNGKTMFAITCEVTTGPYAKRRLWGNLVVSPENPTALGILFRQMNAIGISSQFFAVNPSDDQVASALMGKEFRVQVSIKQYLGTDRNEIKNYMPKTSAANDPAVPPPPISVPPAVGAVPASASPQVAPAPAPVAASQVVTAPAVAPVHVAAPPPPVQPVVPPVPETVPVAPVAPMPVPVTDVIPTPMPMPESLPEPAQMQAPAPMQAMPFAPPDAPF